MILRGMLDSELFTDAELLQLAGIGDEVHINYSGSQTLISPSSDVCLLSSLSLPLSVRH